MGLFKILKKTVSSGIAAVDKHTERVVEQRRRVEEEKNSARIQAMASKANEKLAYYQTEEAKARFDSYLPSRDVFKGCIEQVFDYPYYFDRIFLDVLDACDEDDNGNPVNTSHGYFQKLAGDNVLRFVKDYLDQKSIFHGNDDGFYLDGSNYCGGRSVSENFFYAMSVIGVSLSLLFFSDEIEDEGSDKIILTYQDALDEDINGTLAFFCFIRSLKLPEEYSSWLLFRYSDDLDALILDCLDFIWQTTVNGYDVIRREPWLFQKESFWPNNAEETNNKIIAAKDKYGIKSSRIFNGYLDWLFE